MCYVNNIFYSCMMIMETTEEDGCAAEFEEMVKKTKNLVNPGYDLKNVNDTELAIREFINEVLVLVEQKAPELKVSEIILVGSYQEKTKLFKADEFDFLVVIEELSNPDVFTIETDQDTRPGTVKLRLANREDENGKWQIYSRNGYLRCFGPVLETSCGDSFGYRVIEAISKQVRNNGRSCFRTNNQVNSTGIDPEMIYSRTRPVKRVAFIKKAEVRFPNVLLYFMFDGHGVSVDLCPAIRYTHTEHCFNPDNCSFKDLAAQVMNRGSILLVGHEDFLFRVTYTETEVDYMKSKMKDGHKSLYIFLKVISAYFKESWRPMSSYVLKTICIKHDQLCDRKTNAGSALRCFDELIDDLVSAIQVNSVTSAFDRRLNIFARNYSRVCRVYGDIVVVPVLLKIKKLCRNLTGTGTSQFFNVYLRIFIEEADFDPIKSCYRYIANIDENV